MGRGTSKAGGGSGGGSGSGKASDQDAFVNDMVNAMTRKYDRDEVGFSNSDLQASVEAYTLTHKGVNEDALLNTIRDKVGAISSTSKAAQNIYSSKPTKKAINEAMGTTVAYTFPAGHSIVYEKLDFQDAFYNNHWAVTKISKDGSVSFKRVSEASAADDVLSWNKSKNITQGLSSEKKKKYKQNQSDIVKEMNR